MAIEDDDWRLQGQEKYLLGRTMRWTTWAPYRENWDHDHCEFCMAKISDRFNRLRFAWSVAGDEPTP